SGIVTAWIGSSWGCWRSWRWPRSRLFRYHRSADWTGLSPDSTSMRRWSRPIVLDRSARERVRGFSVVEESDHVADTSQNPNRGPGPRGVEPLDRRPESGPGRGRGLGSRRPRCPGSPGGRLEQGGPGRVPERLLEFAEGRLPVGRSALRRLG